MKKIIYSLVAVCLFSCAKEELAIPAPITEGEVTISSVDITENYSDQVWFDLGTNKEVSRNLKTDWDISFDGSDSSNYIYLNSSLGSKAAITTSKNFNSVTSVSGLSFKSDHQSGMTDSLAIGDWEKHQNVVVIDRGFTPQGRPLGMIKIQFIKLENGVYSFIYSKLDGTDYYEKTVIKNNLYNRTAFSFANHNAVQIEPLKTGYDICFTQYTHIFYNPLNPYLVTGVLINPFKTAVARENEKPFSDINLISALNYTYSTNQDAIGYDWKNFDLGTNNFTIYSNQLYMIEDNEGFNYKLRFLDFYNDNGIKGTATFEFKRL